MIRLFRSLLCTCLLLAPAAAQAYDPSTDQALIRMLGERIDGDVNQGLLPSDRAALLRAELDATQKFVTNSDSQATAMLADIDGDLAAIDNTLDINETNRDLLYHSGDAITVAMRDGAAWQVENVQNADILDVKKPGSMNATGVQGVYLAKQPGFSALTLMDPATGRHIRFRFYIVDKAVRS